MMCELPLDDWEVLGLADATWPAKVLSVLARCVSRIWLTGSAGEVESPSDVVHEAMTYRTQAARNLQSFD